MNFENNEDLKNAYVDSMTGLKNKNYYVRVYKDIAVQMINDLNNNNRVWSVLFCDANNLKYINDNYGHKIGDEGLIALSKIINISKESIRSKNRSIEDIIITPFGEEKTGIEIRIGGDEFLIILPNCNKKNALLVKERINNLIYKSLEETKELTLSIGISDTSEISIPTTLEEKDINIFFDDLVRKAEENMLKEKHKNIKDMPLENQLEIIKKKLSRLDDIGLNFQNPNDIRFLIKILESLEKETNLNK